MDWAFFKKDLQYIFLNQIVSSIPSWTIRNFFYKCSGMKIGPKARIGINTVIISPKGITIGCRSVINDHCVLDGSGGITIKNDVSISAFTKIYSCTHKTDSDFFEYITNPIIIKNNVWIAANAMIAEVLNFQGAKPILGMGSLSNEVITSVVRKTKAKVDEIYYSKIADVILPTSGETPEEISTASCVMQKDVILAGDLNIFRSNKVDGRILSYILNHIVNTEIARVAQGKSVVHVQASEISKIVINYPDTKTQKKMLSVFTA